MRKLNVALLAVLAVVGLSQAACSNSGDATRALSSAGYTNGWHNQPERSGGLS